MKNIFFIVTVFLIFGCAPVNQNTRQVTAASEPKSRIVPTLTSVTEPLNCMDDLFYTAPPTVPLVMISQGVRNESNSSTLYFNDTREVLYSAFSEMTARSNAFSFVDFDDLSNVADARNILKEEIESQGKKQVLKIKPTHILRVSITQADEDIVDSEVGVGLNLPTLFKGFGLPEMNYGKGKRASLISVDMNLVDFNSRKIISGVNSKNSLAVIRSGVKAGANANLTRRPDSQTNTSGTIGETPIDINQSFVSDGAYFLGGLKLTYRVDENESVSRAVRKLVELGLLEVAGKYMKVPYWQCLQNAESVDTDRELRKLFNQMNNRQRLEAVQKYLISNNYLETASVGEMDAATKKSISKFETDSGSTPTGVIGFELYKNLVSLKPHDQSREMAESGQISTSTAELVKLNGNPVAPLITLDKKDYSLGDQVSVKIKSLTEQYVYCYLQDNQDQVVRVFPNRNSENPILKANQTISLGDSLFKILVDSDNATEILMCVASKSDFHSKLPPKFKAKDLQQISVQNINEIIDAYKQVAPLGVVIRSVDIKSGKANEAQKELN